MGFFELFWSDKPNKKQISKQKLRLKEQYAKSEYRQSAMNQLLKWGTSECLLALLDRFKIVVQSLYWDEIEKLWLVDELAKHGESTKKVIKNFILNEDENEIMYPICVLKRICSEFEFIEIILQALNKRKPKDHRSTVAKLELITVLESCSSLNLDTLINTVEPYLEDVHDEVKCIVIDILTEQKNKEIYIPVDNLINIISNNSLSERVLKHAASKICKLNFQIPENKLLAANLTKDFELKTGRLIQRVTV